MNSQANNTAVSRSRAMVIGTSGRMVAALLGKADCVTFVADLYGDSDTDEICSHDFVKLNSLSDVLDLKGILACSNFVVFAGGLEGQSNLATRLAKVSNVAFASADCLEKLADPKTFNAALSDVGIEDYPLLKDISSIKLPCVRKDVTRSGSCKKYLNMPIRPGRNQDSDVFQQWIKGESISLVFVAGNGNVRRLGGTSQLLHRMAWSGSISGLKLSDSEDEIACKFAKRVVKRSGLVGVFGIDFIRNAGGVWPVDVNPRIPASAEVLSRNVMLDHLGAFGFHVNEDVHDTNSREPLGLIQGKQVVFNGQDHPVCIRPELRDRLPYRYRVSSNVPSIADVPHDGEIIEPGHPILTVFVAGESQDIVKSQLRDFADLVLREFTREMQ